jgi:hypothetical protein
MTHCILSGIAAQATDLSNLRRAYRAHTVMLQRFWSEDQLEKQGCGVGWYGQSSAPAVQCRAA